MSVADGQHLSVLAGPRPREASRSSPEPSEAAHPRSLSRGDFAPRSGRGRSSGRTRFDSIDDLISRTGLRRDELATLAEIGALNAFGHDRRSALWQIERAIRPAGELFKHDAARR